MQDEFEIVVVAIFRTVEGRFPSPEAIAKKIVAAFLAEEPKLWSFIYPVTPPAPATRRWRVSVISANLREGPGTAYAVTGYAKQGEVLMQIYASAGWTKTDRGWISNTLIQEVL